jgi:PTS system cellobiose-specific IIC component
MSTGLVAKTTGVIVPWTMPPIISGYLATGGKISGIALQIILLAIDVALYYPFFKMHDEQLLKVESEAA